jgi:hypothetical protein
VEHQPPHRNGGGQEKLGARTAPCRSLRSHTLDLCGRGLHSTRDKL